MPHLGEIEYTYAVSRIRVTEKKLLDKDKLNRMIDAKTTEEAIKILEEADYGDTSSEMANVSQYEKLLSDELKKAYALLKEIAPETEFIQLFLQMNDYHNLKVILKAEFMGLEQLGNMLLESGSIAPNKLMELIKYRKLSELPAIMREAVVETLDIFNRTSDPQMIDLILDKAGFRQMKETADGLDTDFISELAEIRIDLANINSFLRIKKLKKGWGFLQSVLLPDGKIDFRIFMDNLETALESFVEALRFSPYRSILENSIESLKQTGSITRLEKLSDNFIVAFSKQAKYLSFGVEPLIGYLMAKESEIKNVRIILVGKMNGVTNEIIRERLRETYV